MWNRREDAESTGDCSHWCVTEGKMERLLVTDHRCGTGGKTERLVTVVTVVTGVEQERK